MAAYARRSIALLLSLAIAGCAVFADQGADTADEAKETGESETLTAFVAPPPRAKPAALASGAPYRTVDWRGLIGMDEKDVAAILGDPNLEQNVAPAKKWLYTARSCVLTVSFYFDLSAQEFRVLSVEAENNDGAVHGEERCLAQLLAENRATR